MLKMVTATVLCMLVIFFSSHAQELFKVVRVTGRSHYYLLYNAIARPVPDNSTVVALLRDPYNRKHDPVQHLAEISENELLRSYTVKDNDPVPLIQNDLSADSNTLTYLKRSEIFNGNDLVKNRVIIGNYINPAVVKFRGRQLMVTPLQFNLHSGIGSAKRYASNTIEFRWLDLNNTDSNSTVMHEGIGNEIHSLNIDIIGGDPRVLVHNDTYFQIFFAYVLEGYEKQKMSVAEVRYLETEKRMNVTFLAQPMYDKHVLRNSREKNWIPFIYKGEVLLIQAINPTFRVMKMVNYGTPQISTEVYSVTHTTYRHYMHGDIRGGSNALLFDGFYLALYHTKCRLFNNPLETYVWGAYTFSAEPPFRLLNMSISPIMNEEMYTGAWISRFFDYCIYPVSIYMNGDDEIVTSIGLHDRQGVMGTISLSALLKTLAPINQTTSAPIKRF